MILNSNSLKAGITFKLNNNIYVVVTASHFKSARGRAIMKIKAKNFENGRQEHLVLTGKEKIYQAQIDKIKMQYLYQHGDNCIFLNKINFAQIEINKEQLDYTFNYLTEGLEVEILFYHDKILTINLPDKITLKVIIAPPGTKKDTASKSYKIVQVETGMQIQVPVFIKKNDNIIVSTKTGKYYGRQ